MSDFTDKIEQFKKIAKYYEGKGEDALIKDIFNTVLKQKQSGNLTNKQLLDFAEKVKPMLSKEQQQRLTELLKQLTEI